LSVSEDLQCRGVVSAAVRFYDDLHILIERHEEAQQSLNGKLPKLTAQHLRYVGVAGSKQSGLEVGNRPVENMKICTKAYTTGSEPTAKG
jgi:hypothetical protein